MPVTPMSYSSSKSPLRLPDSTYSGVLFSLHLLAIPDTTFPPADCSSVLPSPVITISASLIKLSKSFKSSKTRIPDSIFESVKAYNAAPIPPAAPIPGRLEISLPKNLLKTLL